MDFPWKKKKDEFSEEELLAEIKKETEDYEATSPGAQAGNLPPMPPPMMQKPGAAPMPMPSRQGLPLLPRGLPPPPPFVPVAAQPENAKALSDQQVAKLPLFMKVEEYDKIVADLHTLVQSLEKMNTILENLSKLEQQQRSETDNWRGQLETTRDLLDKLVAHMPETGRLKSIVEERKKHQQKEKIKTEISDLQKDLRKTSAPQHAAKKPPEQLSSDLQNLRTNISSVQEEMRSLHEEIKALADVAKQKAAEQQKQQPSYLDFPTKPEYKKLDTKKPW